MHASSPAGSGQQAEAGVTPPRHLYELYAVMVHHGTAYGGHYFALIKPHDSAHWHEFNDRCVTELSDDDVERAFALAARNAAAATSTGDAAAQADKGGRASRSKSLGASSSHAATANAVDRVSQALSQSAYMLLYRRVGAACWDTNHDGATTRRLRHAPATTSAGDGKRGDDKDGEQDVIAGVPSGAALRAPPELVREVDEDNAQFEHLRCLHDIRERMVEVSVFADAAVQRKVSCQVGVGGVGVSVDGCGAGLWLWLMWLLWLWL